MSQVDDWADGYADSARDVNLYGPASANVPRTSSVVSHQVRYRAPDTSDIPLAPGQNPEGSVYSNASGARMGQLKPASGYRAPAGGWDVNSPDTNLRFPNESGGKQYRVSRTQTAKKSVKKQAQSGKKQPQPEYRTGGARTPEENEITRSAAEHRTGADLGQLNSQALDAAARFLPALKLLLGFGAGAGSAPESSSIEGQFKNMPWYEDAKAHHEAVKKNMDDYGSALGTLKSTWDDIPWWTKLLMLPPVFKAGSPAAGASTTGNVWAEGGRAAAGDATAGAKAFEEALSRMNGGAVRGAPVEGTARSSFSSAGSAENRSFGFDLSPEEVARAKAMHSAYVNGEAAAAGGQAAGREAATAGMDYGKSSFGFNLSPAEAMSAKMQHSAFTSNLAELHSALTRSGMPEREVAAYMQRAGFYNNPEALQQAVFTIRKHGPSGLFERSADEAAAAGSRSFRFDLSPEDVARAEASHSAFIRDAAAGRGSAAAGGQAAGREAAAGGQAAGAGRAGEAAADGGVSELANAGNAGRSSADEAMEVAKGLDELVRRIESGAVDEMDKAWIEALANQKAAGFESDTINYILAAARAAGVIK